MAIKSKLLLLGMLWLPLALTALDIPPKPNQLVNDFGSIISSSEEKKLEAKLVDYGNQTSTQIAIVTIASLEGDDLFDFSQRLAEKWGIGGSENDNGVLLLVAVKEREIRIHTGYGTEGAIPDAIAKRIIENEIKPAFRSNDYYGGLNNATDAMVKALAGEYKADPKKKQRSFPWGLIPLGIIFLVFFVFGGRRRYTGYGHSGRRYYGGPLIGGGLGGSSGGFGGGGGGFGGFGGGGFGGGGASGGW